MVPFHIFLFSLFTKKKEAEVTREQYEHMIQVEKLLDKSREIRSTMNHFM